MQETTDTSRPIYLTPEGTYQFTCKELPTKKPTKKEGLYFFTFKFSYLLEETNKTHTEFLMPWDLPPLLRAFGFEETEKNKFTWDRMLCINKAVTATIVHESDKKDPSKIRARMTDIKKVEEVPF